MELAVTTLSSKGQIVIPSVFRKKFLEGEQFLVIEDGDNLILKSTKGLDATIKEDIEFARRTTDALLRIESGKGTSMQFDDFISEMKKW